MSSLSFQQTCPFHPSWIQRVWNIPNQHRKTPCGIRVCWQFGGIRNPKKIIRQFRLYKIWPTWIKHDQSWNDHLEVIHANCRELGMTLAMASCMMLHVFLSTKMVWYWNSVPRHRTMRRFLVPGGGMVDLWMQTVLDGFAQRKCFLADCSGTTG